MTSAMIVRTCLGAMTLVEDAGCLTRAFFGQDDLAGDVVERQTPLLRAAAQQLDEYFAGRRKDFTLPLRPAGSDFQKKVWAALRAIPYGQTVSYKEIAERLGRPGAARAVGAANHKNPILIVIPCHRVLGANGGLVGYAAGLDVKKQLLALERAQGAF